MASDLFDRLPAELIDIVFTQFANDPSAVVSLWAGLRLASRSWKQYIEGVFRRLWLPHVRIQILDYASQERFQFRLKSTSGAEHGRATFSYCAQPPVSAAGKARLSHLLQTKQIFDHGPAASLYIITLGEGLFSEGLRGGHMVNNTELADLEIDCDQLEISVDWRKTMDKFMLEENTLRNDLRDFDQSISGTRHEGPLNYVLFYQNYIENASRAQRSLRERLITKRLQAHYKKLGADSDMLVPGDVQIMQHKVGQVHTEESVVPWTGLRDPPLLDSLYILEIGNKKTYTPNMSGGKHPLEHYLAVPHAARRIRPSRDFASGP